MITQANAIIAHGKLLEVVQLLGHDLESKISISFVVTDKIKTVKVFNYTEDTLKVVDMQTGSET